MVKRRSLKKFSRKQFRGGFIRANTPQFGNQYSIPNPTYLNTSTPQQECVSCQTAGGRRSRRLSRRLRRRF